MNELIIWTTDGQVRTIIVDDDMLDYEVSVLNVDPMVKAYSVRSM